MYLTNIIFLILITINIAHGSNIKTSKVTTHNRITIVNNPKTGLANYPSWAIFPSKKEKIRRVVMNVTLGSPDSLKTAHWDYCDHINILRIGGRESEIKNYEIGRILTPYGAKYKKDWKFKWSVDVTDFANILRDSVEIEFKHSGYEDISFGWTLTIDFDITHGEPHIKQIDFDKLWCGNFKYGNPETPFEKQVKPINFEMPKKAKIAKLRIQHTGHGMDKPNNCSEFCSRWREIYIDDKVIQKRDLWKNCGDNPLYPQAGTWLYDRALWCPGDLQEPDIINTYLQKGNHQLKLKMEPYTSEKVAQPKENINSMIFYYGLPKNKNDVAIEEILSPNNNPFYNRLNPAINKPKIKIRNLGSRALQTLRIKYFTIIDNNNYNEKEYIWTGYLEYYESEIIELPGEIYADKNSKNSFRVECYLPNEKRDAWLNDNYKIVQFNAPTEVPREFIIQYKTNTFSHENIVELKDIDGNIIYSKNSNNTKANTVYNDTIKMPPNTYCGEITLTDTAGNGLEYWAHPTQGYGILRLLDTSNHLIHEFEKDCGDGEKFAFNISESFSKNENQNIFYIYPQRIDNEFYVYAHSNTPESKMQIAFIQNNKIKKSFEYQRINKNEYKFNTSSLSKEPFFIYIYIDGKVVFKKYIMRIKS